MSSYFINSSDDLQNVPEVASTFAAPPIAGGKPLMTGASAGEEQSAPDVHVSRLRAALTVAHADNLDTARVARGISIARNLGLPQSVVMADLEYARREEVARKIEANPLLASWAAKNEFNAAVAAGDADTLNALFDSVQKEHQKLQATRPDMGIGSRVITLLEEGTRDVAQGLDGFLVGFARELSRETVIEDDEGNEIVVPENTTIAK